MVKRAVTRDARCDEVRLSELALLLALAMVWLYALARATGHCH